MKILLNSLFVLLTTSTMSQSITVYSNFNIDSNKIKIYQKENSLIHLTNEQLNIIGQKAIKQSYSSNKLILGYLGDYYRNRLSNTSYKKDKIVSISGEKFYHSSAYLNKTNYTNLFRNDSILLEFWNYKKSSAGEIELDGKGDKVMVDFNSYEPIAKSIRNINLIEKWEYKNAEFHKIALISSIYIGHFDEINKGSFTLNSKKNNLLSTYLPFISDVNYTQSLFKSYNSILLDTNINEFEPEYWNYLAIGLREQSGINDKDFNEFIQSIFKDIYNGKLKIYELDSNENKTNIPMSISKLNRLIEIKSEYSNINFETDEEDNYSNEGQEIWTSTSIHMVESNDILGFEFDEDWFIAEDYFNIKKKVKGMMMIIEVYDVKLERRVNQKIPAYISFE